MKEICFPHLEPHVPCISRSGADMTKARKADFAITRGVNFQEICSWVGFSFPPHASDCHNTVPVTGTLRNSATAAAPEMLLPGSEAAPTLPATASSDHGAGADVLLLPLLAHERFSKYSYYDQRWVSFVRRMLGIKPPVRRGRNSGYNKKKNRLIEQAIHDAVEAASVPTSEIWCQPCDSVEPCGYCYEPITHAFQETHCNDCGYVFHTWHYRRHKWEWPCGEEPLTAVEISAVGVSPPTGFTLQQSTKEAKEK